VIEDGELKGYLGRFEGSEKVKRKYRNSEGTDFAKLVLGIDELNNNVKELLIVEGIFDKVNVDDKLNLKSNLTRKCVCTFGARCTNEQLIKILMKASNIERIYVMHESDVIDSVKKTGLKCQNYVKDTKVCHIDEKDPGEMSEKELVNCLALSKDPLAFNIGTVKKGILH
jgi:DNA primase